MPPMGRTTLLCQLSAHDAATPFDFKPVAIIEELFDDDQVDMAAGRLPASQRHSPEAKSALRPTSFFEGDTTGTGGVRGVAWATHGTNVQSSRALSLLAIFPEYLLARKVQISTWFAFV